ncbi:hypothetical protein [Cohnella thermotolerans]|uniref:hypothetical protein n=1 Tax=Cohnella thermotolerans TaxID=329858 RepID=UPI000688F3B0|nr:hypothetical protein [Cohnella thermotolerans]
MAQLYIPGTAAPADVLSGKSFSAGTNYIASGAMPNNGAVTITPSASAQTIPAGYHNGSGKVNAVTFDASKVLTGTTIAGTAGTMSNRGAMVITPSTTSQGIPEVITTGTAMSRETLT